PGLVERGQVAVGVAQPVAPGGDAVLAVALPQRRPVLVVHVPHDHGGVAAVVGGERADQAGGGLAEGGRAGAGALPAAEADPHALPVDGEGVGVAGGEPGGRRGGGCGQVDGDAGG